MNGFVAFFKLIRLPNLLIIALTQYLMRYCIIQPLAQINDFELQFSELNFFLLCLSTTMIAAAGYIINDYFDIRIDRINKPDKIIVGRFIKRRVAMGAHVVINILALLIAAYVAYTAGVWKLIFLHVFAVISLWYYATEFKRQFITGNLIIALLAALVPLIVGLYEIPLMTWHYQGELISHGITFNYIAYWIIAYTFFAFFITFAREIVKDMADVKGDEAYKCRTIPIVMGMNKARNIVLIIYLIIALPLIYLQQTYLHDEITLFYMLLIFTSFFIIMTYKTWKANEKEQYKNVASWNKLLTLSGILYAPLVYYIIKYYPLV